VNPTKRQGTTNIDVRQAGLAPTDLLRLGRLARELRLTDQILSVDLDSVSIVDHGPAPAWTTLDGDHIHFALSRMPAPESGLDVAVWLGTNAHELGHVLYSPRRGSELMCRVVEGEAIHLQGIANLHNIVEDQRQERLLLGRFAAWRPYLIAALGHHLVVEDDAAWILLAGRTWLPAGTRAAARARFAAAFSEAAAAEIAEIVGTYQRLTDPGDTEAGDAWALLLRLHALLDTAIPPPSAPCQTIDGGEPEIDDAGTDAPPTADEAEAEQPGGAEGEGEQASPEGEQASPEGEQAEGDGAGGEGGSGTSEGRGDPQRGRSGAGLRRELSAVAAEAIAADADAAADLSSVLAALRSGPAGDAPRGDGGSGEYRPVTDIARRLRHEIADALLDLKDAVEPGWLKRTDSGRLNVRRLADPGTDADELFDRYDPGLLDAADTELVLLLDASGSMRTSMPALAEATWAIRHAIDDLEGTATVIAWDSGPHRVLAAPGERPDDRMFVADAMGGTLPTSALAEAYRITADSPARNRLVVILTDGEWGEGAVAGQLIAGLNEAGVVTVLAALGPYAKDNAHGCTHFARIEVPADLARLFGTVAAEQIGAW